jgi:hypothetical protein
MDLCAFSKFFSQLLKRTAKSDLLATVLTIWKLLIYYYKNHYCFLRTLIVRIP